MKKIVIMMLVMMFASLTFAQTNDLSQFILKKNDKEQTLLDVYGKSLDSIMTNLTAKGDLDNYVVMETEKNRFVAEKTVPVTTNGLFKVPAELCIKAQITLLKQYIAALDSFIKTETKAGKIAEAKDGKAEKDKAAIELAALESKIPKVETKIPAVTNVVVKTSNVKKSIVGKWSWLNWVLEFSSNGIVTLTTNGRTIHEPYSGKWSYIDAAKTKIKRVNNDGGVMIIDFDEKNPDVWVVGNQNFIRVKETSNK